MDRGGTSMQCLYMSVKTIPVNYFFSQTLPINKETNTFLKMKSSVHSMFPYEKVGSINERIGSPVWGLWSQTDIIF